MPVAPCAFAQHWTTMVPESLKSSPCALCRGLPGLNGMIRCLGLLFPSHDRPIIGQPHLGYPAATSFHPQEKLRENFNATYIYILQFNKSGYLKIWDNIYWIISTLIILDNISKSGKSGIMDNMDNHHAPVLKVWLMILAIPLVSSP